MTHVTTHYRVLVVQGHHRQPRNGSSWIEPNAAGGGEVVPGTAYSPPTQPSLAYAENGQTKVATFLFWSVSDGTSGSTSTAQSISPTIGANPTTVTAWYLPPGGTGPGGGPGFVLDAFSDALGDFIDDTFVTATPDGALTNDANVVGDISTASQETLHAVGSVHTGEVFEHWIAIAEQGQAQPNVVGQDATLAAGTSGVAIATYRRSDVSLPNLPLGAQEGWVILGGIAVDGPGWAFPIGHPGGGGPVGPWGPFLERVMRAGAVASLGSHMDGAAQIGRMALGEVEAATKQLGAQIAKG